MLSDLPFTLAGLRQAYADGTSPQAVVEEAFRRLEAAADPGIFIHEARETALAEAAALGAPDGRPLWGIPYAVKDNIDVAGMPTTAACPDFAYDAEDDAFAVAQLRAAGAICIGKTNLDQFATGLVGVRTPYPVPRNAIDPDIVPGGSSSGSAVAVAQGIVCFSLGTDTAGSGRVPAALNSIVGIKPTLGVFSSAGMVPACRTLDTISVFALTVADAWAVLESASDYNPSDAWSRKFPPAILSPLPPFLQIAVPDAASLVTFGDDVQAEHFRTAVANLRTHGAVVHEIDFTPFYDVAKMLYEGAWVAERTAAVGARLIEAPGTLHPTTRAIVEPGLGLSAVDAFEGIYRLRELKRACEETLSGIDLICVPTIPCFVTMAEIEADPVAPNSRLGTYTNFVNLLDLCGIAVPAGARGDGRPGSLTILARAGEDARTAALATAIEHGALGATGWTRPPPPPLPEQAAASEIAVAVCGAHMSGLPLNHELTSRGARFLRACRTATDYRFHALAGGPPARPGLVRTADGAGGSIAVEVWAMPRSEFGGFMAGIPEPLCIGTLALEDGTTVKGFLCESRAAADATEITHLGSWRAYMDLISGTGSTQPGTRKIAAAVK